MLQPFTLRNRFPVEHKHHAQFLLAAAADTLSGASFRGLVALTITRKTVGAKVTVDAGTFYAHVWSVQHPLVCHKKDTQS